LVLYITLCLRFSDTGLKKKSALGFPTQLAVQPGFCRELNKKWQQIF
jgi:hypothetical protein